MCLEGISLTVNEVQRHMQFGVNIIPHTAEKTTLGKLQTGQQGESGSGYYQPLSGTFVSRDERHGMGHENRRRALLWTSWSAAVLLLKLNSPALKKIKRGLFNEA